MEHQHLHHDHGSSYGAISPVKRAMQQLRSPPHHDQHAVNFGKHSATPDVAGTDVSPAEPESGNLVTTAKILHGGRDARSRDRLSRYEQQLCRLQLQE